MRAYRIATRFCGVDPKFVGLALFVGLCRFPAYCSPDENGTGAHPGAATLRVKVIPNVPRACGPAVSTSILQDAAAAHLTGAGIAVSNAHNSQLAIDLDCSAAAPAGTPISVRACLTFSELVVAPLEQNKTLLASTWRRCESYACTRAKCDAARRQDGMLTELLSELGNRNGGNGLQIQPMQPQPEPEGAPAQALAQQNDILKSAPSEYWYPAPPKRSMKSTIFYSTYIMNCLIILVYWQFKKRASSIS